MKRFYITFFIIFIVKGIFPQADSHFERIDESVKIIWQKKGETNLPVKLLIKDDKIISAENNKILCFNLSGRLLWEYHSSGTIKSKPALEGDLAAASTYEGDILTINSNNGELVQVIGLGEPLTTDLQIIDISYSGMRTKGIVAGSENGNVYCYGLYSLEFIWENLSAEGEADKFLLHDKKIIFSSTDNNIYCIDASSGSLIWKWNSSIKADSTFSTSIVTDGKYFFAATPDGSLNAINLLLGTTSWKKNLSVTGLTGIIGSNIFLKNNDNIFMIISAKDGAVLNRIRFLEQVGKINTVPFSWKDNIIFGTDDGNIFLIDAAMNIKHLIYLGTTSVNFVQHIKDNLFAASNDKGDIFVFTLN